MHKITITVNTCNFENKTLKGKGNDRKNINVLFLIDDQVKLTERPYISHTR